MWISFLQNLNQQSDNPTIWPLVAMTIGKDFCIFVNNHSTFCFVGTSFANYNKIVAYVSFLVKYESKTTLVFKF